MFESFLKTFVQPEDQTGFPEPLPFIKEIVFPLIVYFTFVPQVPLWAETVWKPIKMNNDRQMLKINFFIRIIPLIFRISLFYISFYMMQESCQIRNIFSSGKRGWFCASAVTESRWGRIPYDAGGQFRRGRNRPLNPEQRQFARGDGYAQAELSPSYLQEPRRHAKPKARCSGKRASEISATEHQLWFWFGKQINLGIVDRNQYKKTGILRDR